MPLFFSLKLSVSSLSGRDMSPWRPPTVRRNLEDHPMLPLVFCFVFVFVFFFFPTDEAGSAPLRSDSPKVPRLLFPIIKSVC